MRHLHLLGCPSLSPSLVMRCMDFPAGRSNLYPHTMRVYNRVPGTSPIHTQNSTP